MRRRSRAPAARIAPERSSDRKIKFLKDLRPFQPGLTTLDLPFFSIERPARRGLGEGGFSVFRISELPNFELRISGFGFRASAFATREC